MNHRFNHVHLKAPDPGKAAQWYVDAFDFTIVEDSVRAVGDRFIRCDTADGVRINISNARTGEQLGREDYSAHWGLEHIGFNVDDLDGEITRLVGLGAELLEGPIDQSGGLRIAFMKSPEGTRLELLQDPV